MIHFFLCEFWQILSFKKMPDFIGNQRCVLELSIVFTSLPLSAHGLHGNLIFFVINLYLFSFFSVSLDNFFWNGACWGINFGCSGFLYYSKFWWFVPNHLLFRSCLFGYNLLCFAKTEAWTLGGWFSFSLYPCFFVASRSSDAFYFLSSLIFFFGQCAA